MTFLANVPNVMFMGQFIKLLLIFLIVMPSTVCAMAVCAKSQTQTLPCHKTMSPGATDKSGGPHKVMLMIDCMGVDLQFIDELTVGQPDLSKVFSSFFVSPVFFVPQSDLFSASKFIRGPPPDWPAFSQAQPSILLTTQRLRI